MKKTENYPKQYLFPNYCFEENQNKIFYLRDSILAGEENTNIFFSLLGDLESIDGKSGMFIYEILIPFDIDIVEMGYMGQQRIKIEKGVKCFNLSQLKDFLISIKYLDGTMINFKNIVNEFWIKRSDGKQEIFVSIFWEIVILGLASDIDASALKNKDKYIAFFYESIDGYLKNTAIPVLRIDKESINKIKINYA